jgi:hypothetical protein
MATLAFLRTVVDSAGKNTGEFECSACGKRFHPDKAHHGAVDIDVAFIEHRLTETISSPNGLPRSDGPLFVAMVVCPRTGKTAIVHPAAAGNHLLRLSAAYSVMFACRLPDASTFGLANRLTHRVAILFTENPLINKGKCLPGLQP